MSFLFDLIMIALPVIGLIIGYKKGFLPGIIKIGLFVLSVLSASALTPLVASSLTDSFPFPGSGTRLTSLVSSSFLEDPQIHFFDLFKKFGFTDKAASTISAYLESHTEEFNRSIAKTLSESIDSLLSRTCVFLFLLLFFVLLSIFLNVLINKAFSFTTAGKIDRIFGMALHGFLYLSIMFLLCFLISWTLPLLDSVLDLNLTSRLIGKSLILKITENINLFSFIL